LNNISNAILGTFVEGYEVVAKLHDNGVTAIYVLENEIDSKALKLSLTPSADSIIRHEARVLSQIKHPGIIKLISSIEIGSRPALILERLYGDLAERLPLSENQTVYVVRQLLPAIKAVHTAGYAHLDLKPENIGLNHENRPVIIDFGLAKPIGSRLESATGSREYMAPELERANVDVKANLDLYALGITIFELLYDAFPEWNSQKTSPSFPHPPPKALRNKLTRWLNPNPEKRFKSALEEDTEPFIEMTVKSKPKTNVSAKKGKPFFHIFMGLAIIGLIAGLIVLLFWKND